MVKVLVFSRNVAERVLASLRMVDSLKEQGYEDVEPTAVRIKEQEQDGARVAMGCEDDGA